MVICRHQPTGPIHMIQVNKKSRLNVVSRSSQHWSLWARYWPTWTECQSSFFPPARQLINIRGGRWVRQRLPTELLIQWCLHYTNIGWTLCACWDNKTDSFTHSSLERGVLVDWKGCIQYTAPRCLVYHPTHTTELLQTFTCVIDITTYIIIHGVSSYYALWTIKY